MDQSTRSLHVYTMVAILLVNASPVGGACDYTSLTTSLNTCVATASGSTNTKWMFPYGTIAQQALFCTSSAQTTLQTCITAVFSTCQVDAKSLKMFSTDGANLITAYTDICSNSLVTEAQACMSVITPLATYTTAESTFTTRVDALPTAAEDVQICGLAKTLKYSAYTTLLGATCTTTSHLAVWALFYDTVLDTNLCTTCDASTNQISYWMLIFVSVLVFNVT